MEVTLMPTTADRAEAGLVLLSPTWESLGWMFPRVLLRMAEIRGWPKTAGILDPAEDLGFWRARKIALVRQSAYGGLYKPGPVASWMERVLTAGKHLGPFSFLADLDADYWVVRQSTEPETYLWRGKYSLDPDPEASYRRVEEHTRAREASAEASHAVSVDDIDWSVYDLVVGLDVPIPERIVKKCTRTLWAYYSIEAGGPLQKNSLSRPAAGYHLFFNHCFRRFRCRPRNRRHVLEFPFTFQSRQAWAQLARQAGQDIASRENQVVLDQASPLPPRVGNRLKLRHLEGSSGLNPTREYIRQMASSRFAIRTAAKVRWGNWAGEAIQAGCLFLGRADSLAMPGVLLPDLVAVTTAEAWTKAEALLEDPEKTRFLLRLQGDLTEHLCFRRPLADLTHRAREFFRR